MLNFSRIVAGVGMEMTSYTITEDDGAMVEVCAIVHSSSSNCSIQFPFTVTGLSTINGTASNGIHRTHNKIDLMIFGWLQCPLRIM